MRAQRCTQTGHYFITGYSGRKYWGHTARAAEQLAQLYFYN
jgi:hypothetical protein